MVGFGYEIADGQKNPVVADQHGVAEALSAQGFRRKSVRRHSGAKGHHRRQGAL
jgi:hypothetical protein